MPIGSKNFSMRVLILLLSFLGPLSLAADNPANAPTAANLQYFKRLLVGEFDSGRQAQTDKENGVDEKNAHGWVNRFFMEVSASAVAEHVLVGSTRYGGEEWLFDKDEFLVWILRADPDFNGILMSPRRFKKHREYSEFARDPLKLSDFSSDELEGAVGGASCDILWRPSKDGFSGQSKPCYVMSTTKHKMLNWVWNYELSKDALWISFTRRDENGENSYSTPENSPYRLDRLAASAEYELGRYILLNTHDRNEYDTAIKYLEKAVALEPENGAARVSLIYAYTKKNRFTEAAQQLNDAEGLKESMSSSDVLWLEALKHLVADNPEEQIKAWTAVLEAEPKNRWAWYGLLAAHYRLEQYSETVAAAEQALFAEPNEQAWSATMISYLHSKAHYRLGNFDEAINAAEPGVRNPATRRATYFRKALAEIAAGKITDLNEVLDTYRKYSLRNGKLNESVYYANLGLLFFELGDYDKAVEYAQMSHDLSTGPYQSFTLGYSLIEKGEIDAALEILDPAITEHPNNLYVVAAKGWAMYRLSRYTEAKSMYLKAKSLSRRKNSAVERDLKIIQAAIDDPTIPQVPPVRWFGD